MTTLVILLGVLLLMVVIVLAGKGTAATLEIESRRSGTPLPETFSATVIAATQASLTEGIRQYQVETNAGPAEAKAKIEALRRQLGAK